MTKVTGAPAVLWGSSVVGFGERTLTIASGVSYPWMEVGFAPRKGGDRRLSDGRFRGAHRPAGPAGPPLHRQGVPLPEAARRRGSRGAGGPDQGVRGGGPDRLTRSS